MTARRARKRGDELRIRPFVETDTEAVVALWSRCGLLRPWNDPRKDIARKLLVQRELFVVGELAGTLVAAMMVGYEGHRGWVNYLAVEPGVQGRGFGRRMMAEAERRLRARGCPKIQLQVRDGNVDAIAFYGRLGYSVDAVVSMGKRLVADDGSRVAKPHRRAGQDARADTKGETPRCHSRIGSRRPSSA